MMASDIMRMSRFNKKQNVKSDVLIEMIRQKKFLKYKVWVGEEYQLWRKKAFLIDNAFNSLVILTEMVVIRKATIRERKYKDVEARFKRAAPSVIPELS